MVIDAAKGIEPQTRKLFEVCRLRSVPIITFVNKVDREGRSAVRAARRGRRHAGARRQPDELAGRHGRAVRRRARLRQRRGQPARRRQPRVPRQAVEPTRPSCPTRRSPRKPSWRRRGYPEFDLEAYRHGDLTPVYFGSALKNFGVAELIDAIAALRPAAAAAAVASRRRSSPTRDEVTGFVFKVQANMDPQHRDRIAFMRHGLGHLQARHEADALGARQADRGALADPVLRPGPRARRHRRGRRHHRHPQPRHAARRRHAEREERGPLHRPAQLRARDPAPGGARGPDQDQAAAQGARRPGRGRRDPGVLPGDRRAVDRRRGRPAPARRADLAARGRIQGRGRRSRPAPFATARWLKGRDAALKELRASSTAATSPATATATRCSWPARPGTSATSRNSNPELTFSATKER